MGSDPVASGSVAEAALADALEDAGFRLTVPDSTADVALDLGAGRVVYLEVKSLANASPERVKAQIEASGHARRLATGADHVFVLVGRAIPAASREMLNQAAWGWLDQRGHLRLHAPGIRVDTEVATAPRREQPKGPAVVGRAGLVTALAALADPSGPVAVRATARGAGLNPSSVSRAYRRLREAGLVHGDGRPVLPELFWALSDVWPQNPQPLKRAPSPDDDADGTLQMNANSLDEAGWALSGTRAALAWGAPLVAAASPTADLYVPSSASERRARQRYEPAARLGAAAATVQCAFAPSVGRRRWRREGEPWPVAHPVVVALDLAADRARGPEILAAWQPPAPFVRVW